MLALEEVRTSLKAKKRDPKELRKALMSHYLKAKKELTLNDLSRSIYSAVYDASPSGQAQAASMSSYSQPEYWYVDDVIIDESAVVICADGEHYKASYTLDSDKKVTLAPRDEWVSVEQRWVPKDS